MMRTLISFGEIPSIHILFFLLDHRKSILQKSQQLLQRNQKYNHQLTNSKKKSRPIIIDEKENQVAIVINVITIPHKLAVVVIVIEMIIIIEIVEIVVDIHLLHLLLVAVITIDQKVKFRFLFLNNYKHVVTRSTWSLKNSQKDV